ncbi:MAG: hypothetical protein WEB00_07370 [Dehalococcoidia bacterium]
MTGFSTNGASEEPAHGAGGRGLAMLLIFGGFLIVGVFVALVFLQPSAKQDVGRALTYEFGSVTRFPSNNYYLVRLDSGEFLALYDRDTGPDARRRGCRITFDEEQSVAGETGVFVGDCTGSAWSMSGLLLDGPSPRDMDQLSIDVDDDGSVTVDAARLICGEGEVPQGGLNSQCLPFRDERSE